MTNGIAVGKTDPIARDYWHNETCSSGYSSTLTPPTLLVLKNFIAEGKSWNKDRDLWDEYSPLYVLAVLEQLVWWGEDDQEV